MEKYEINMEGFVDTFIDEFPELEKLSEEERLDLYRELEDRFVGRAKDWIRSWLSHKKLREVV